MALRITERRARGKARCIPCCLCEQEHPEDKATHRMQEHAHKGRRCLGSDIPFARHTHKPMGKLVGCIVSQVPMPNRARAIQLADGFIPASIIEQVAAEPFVHDFHPLFWIDRMLMLKRAADLDADIAPLRRSRPRLVERRAT